MKKILNTSNPIKKQSIGTKVLFLIIFCGFFFAIAETGVQLYLDYKVEIQLVEEQIKQIGNSYLKSITKSSWNMEGDEVRLHLEGALQLRDIKYLEVRTEIGDILASSGTRPSQKIISRTLPLEYNNHGKVTSIGILHVIASGEGLYQRLFKKMAVILVIRLLIALFISGFFLFIFQHLVSRHLTRMADYTQQLDLNSPRSALILNRPPLKDNAPDELEKVVFAINEMQLRIQDFMAENKLSRDALKKSEKQYRLIAENATDVIWTMDMDFNYTYISPSVYQQRGYSVEEAMAHSPREVLLPDSFEKVMDIFVKTLSLIKSGNKEGFRPIKFEAQQSCKDGSAIWTSNNIKFLHDSDTQAISMLGITHNITEQKQAEEKLRASEERLKAIFMASPDPIVVYNNQGHPEYMNEAFADLFDWRLDDLKDRCIPFVPEDQKEITTLKIKEIYKSGDPVQFETKRLTRHGLIIDVLLSAAIIKDSKGRKKGLVVDLKDMTASKKLEAQVQQSQKMESIGTLAGGIAHDFNNILFPVLGHTEMLLYDIPENNPIHSNLKKIHAGANRAKELVKQILTFARQEQNELKLIKIQSIVKEALKLIRSSIPTTISIEQDIKPDCGFIMADPTQIHQIVMNLATNAYHAMEDTGGELKVILKEIDLKGQGAGNHDIPAGEYLCLSVLDTGTGVDKEIKSKIFDPFFSTKEIGKGTGMGLSVVHGIVKNMGGTIQVKDRPSHGTAFNVYFPRVKSFYEKQIPQLTHGTIHSGTEHILIIDDEEDIVRMVKKMLQRMGYKISSRTSSLEALDDFREAPEKFDLVITDMAMPRLSGEHLARELIKIRSDIPILLCTGFSNAMSDDKAASIGIKGFLMKPIEMNELSQKLREVLD